MNVTFHEEALDEMLESALSYEDRAAGLGRDFLMAIEQAGRLVLASAEAGPVARGDVRKRIVAGFSLHPRLVDRAGSHFRRDCGTSEPPTWLPAESCSQAKYATQGPSAALERTGLTWAVRATALPLPLRVGARRAGTRWPPPETRRST